jgi:hypothetical protein
MSGSVADRPNASSQGFPIAPIGTETWTSLAEASPQSLAALLGSPLVVAFPQL